MAELTTWLIRGTLLLLIGYLIGKVLQTRSAAMAHRILLVTLFAASVLPLLVWGLPKWDLNKPQWASTAPAAVNLERAEPKSVLPTPTDAPSMTTAIDQPLTSNIDDQIERLPADDQAAQIVTVTPIAAQPIQGPDGRPSLSLSWFHCIALAWFLGFIALATRLFIGFARLIRFVRGCDVANNTLTQLVQESAFKLNVHRRLRVVVAPVGSMPMACWIGRWIIVLPRDIEHWENPLSNATITHELGHISRRDAWTDLFANAVSCVLWPHPLIWVIANSITRLRERACDEWVLQKSKLDEVGYANSLVTVIQRCQTQSLRMASSMATKKDFESRLRWLVSGSRPQKASPIVTTVVAVAIATFSLVVATAQVVDPPIVQSAPVVVAGGPSVILSDEPSPKSPAISVSGSVVDNRTGKPIAGADVVLRADVSGASFSAMSHAKDILARTKTDDRGKFVFAEIGVPPRMTGVLTKLRKNAGRANLIALAPGMGMKWIAIPTFQNAPQVLKLDPEADVRGKIVDQDDQPVPNASLYVRALYADKAMLDYFAKGPGDLDLYSEFRVETLANEQGEFRISNLPHDYRAIVWGQGESGQRAFFIVDTGKNDFETIRVSGTGSDKESRVVHRTPIHVQTQQHPWIKVRVIDHNGMPVAAGGIEAVNQARHYVGQANVRGDGTAILTVNDPGPHQISFGAPPLSDLLGAWRNQISILPEEQDTVEIRLPKPRFATGKVLDADTGKPIVGVWVFSGHGLDCSDADGQFRVPVKPGKTKIRVLHKVDGYRAPSFHATRKSGVQPEQIEIDVPEDDAPIDEVTIKISRGLVVKGIVVAPSGKPIAGVPVRAENQDRPYTKVSTISDRDGRFELGGLSPLVATRVSAQTKFGAAETIIPAKADQPWEKTLARAIALRVETGTTLTGRVVHKGKPMAGVTMRLTKSPPTKPGQKIGQYRFFGETKTDAKGRYSITGLKKGEHYEFEIIAPGNLQARGWEYQSSSPYVHSVTVEDGETVELPDVKLTSNGQILRGIVVDPGGNPVGGIRVSAQLKSGEYLAPPLRGPPPWTTTDADGKFELVNLPDELIVLRANKPNPAGGVIRNPSRAAVDLNAKDIRIVLDPKLGTGIEDLD